MSERAYTVAEIDALRAACSARWLWGTTAPTGHTMSRSYGAGEEDKGTEELVRTYMLAGITAAEIYAEDAKRAEEYRAAKEKWDKDHPSPEPTAMPEPTKRRGPAAWWPL